MLSKLWDTRKGRTCGIQERMGWREGQIAKKGVKTLSKARNAGKNCKMSGKVEKYWKG